MFKEYVQHWNAIKCIQHHFDDFTLVIYVPFISVW